MDPRRSCEFTKPNRYTVIEVNAVRAIKAIGYPHDFRGRRSRTGAVNASDGSGGTGDGGKSLVTDDVTRDPVQVDNQEDLYSLPRPNRQLSEIASSAVTKTSS